MPATRHRIIAALERCSSESSIYTASGTSYVATDSDASSSSPASAAALALKQRRTRKRITPAQLAALEDLFTRTSHPSQQERDLLARAINMSVFFSLTNLPPSSSRHLDVFRVPPEVKNVTIWFQNRRQAARKMALHEAIVHSNCQSTVGEDYGSLADSLGRASPVTPDPIATPPANEEQLGTFMSSCPSPAVGDSTWHPNGPRSISQNDLSKSTFAKCELDKDTFAAAMALTQMRTVDAPAV